MCTCNCKGEVEESEDEWRCVNMRDVFDHFFLGRIRRGNGKLNWQFFDILIAGSGSIEIYINIEWVYYVSVNK